MRSISLEGLTIDFIAETRIKDGQKEFVFADEGCKIYKKVFTDSNIPCGAYLINAHEELEKFGRLIEGTMTLAGFPELVPAESATAHSPDDLLTAESPQTKCL